MTINNLPSALELWDNGFNIIPINSSIIPPSLESPAKDARNYKKPLGKWQKYQTERESRGLVQNWF